MNTRIRISLSILVISSFFILPVLAQAASPSPFAGHWEAIDDDGSDIRLTIAGPPQGPFRITWTDSYISFCDGEAGIVRGIGWLNEGDSNLLEADLLLKCFANSTALDFHLTFRYHPAVNTLSVRYSSGQIVIWHRPGNQQPPAPALNLRVNYGHDWVESFYETGHTAWIVVTESDGATAKASAELVTEPKDYWEGETGFQSMDSNWFDADGNPMEYPPDIQPYDRVFGWVDNGASAQVQIGDINGIINLNADSITGTINAPWFSDKQLQVEVECLPWGAPKPIDNVIYGMLNPDNQAAYSCTWLGEWNILPYQDVGVGYFAPDGHWVANAFFVNLPQIVASESGDWFWTSGFDQGLLDLFIYESADEDAALLWQGSLEADEGGFVSVEYEDHGQDLVPGNFLVVSDGVNPKELVLVPIAVEVFDTENEIMAGTSPPGSEVWAAAGPIEWQERIFVEADPVSGDWWADFTAIGFDITEEMRTWSFAHIYDGDGDANEGSTPPPEMDLRVNYGHGWVESIYEAGHEVTLLVTNSEGEEKATATVFTEPKDFWGGEPGFQTTPEDWSPALPDLMPNDWVYAQVDKGVSVQVQLGDIQGEVRFDLDNVSGTIFAPWIGGAVPVECLDWGSGGDPINKDAGAIIPDGTETYECVWDPETEWDVQPWQDIGVGYFTPEGNWVANAFRDERWMAVWTYDPPAGPQGEGQHSFYFDLAYTVPEEVDLPPGDPQIYTVAEETPLYEGVALLGPWDYMPIQVWNGSACEVVSGLNPDQPIRFISGWVNDYSMTYEEALAHFSSITVDLFWDGEAVNSTSFEMSELLPFFSREDRIEYTCSFTEHP